MEYNMTYEEQVAAMIEQIAPVLKADLDVERYAIGMIEENWEEDSHYEVAGRHTKSGNPHTFRI
jgi:hypothetical protein